MSTESSSITILCVDDEPGLADLTGAFLERFDDTVTVKTTTTGLDGLDYLANNTVDCIVSDYDMPTMDGLVFLQAVRADHPNLPFILFTGRGSEEIASDAISAGVSDYMQKGAGTDQYQVLAQRIQNLVTRNRAQQEALQAHKRAQTILSASPDAILVSVAEKHVYANPAAVSLFAAENEGDLIDMSLPDLAQPDDRDTIRATLAQSLEGNEVTNCVSQALQTLDGQSVTVDLTARQIEWDGQAGMVVILRDLTEQEQQKLALRENTRQFQSVLNTVDAAIYMKDTERRYLLMNRECRKILGVEDEEDVLGYTDDELFTSEAARQLQNHDTRVFNRGETIEFEESIPTTDGVRTFLTRKTPVLDEDGDAIAVCGVSTDITERKDAERDLAHSEQQYRSLAENFPNGAVLLFDTELRYQLAHGPQLEEVGLTLDGLVGKQISDVFEGETLVELSELYRATLRGESRSQQVEYGGHVYQIETTPIPDENGDIRLGMVIAQVITDRVRREEELETLQQRLEFAFGVTDSILWTVDLDTDSTTTLTGPIERLLSVEPANVTNVEEFFKNGVHPDDSGTLQEVYAGVQAGDIEQFSFEFRTRPNNGDVQWFAADGFVDSAAGSRIIVGIFTDITAYKTRECELKRQNNRLSEFASVVSHDLRNPLNVIQGHLELAQEDCTSDHLDTIEKSLFRMDALIDDLLTLARNGDSIADIETVDLRAVISDCWKTIDAGDAILSINVERQIKADESRLKQLFENLLRNAVEHGGKDISVTIGELSNGFFVEDDGPGIPPDERNDVFTNGYSTRRDGTGFGLGIVKQIGEAHGWDIHLTDGVEGGARFEFTGIEFDE